MACSHNDDWGDPHEEARFSEHQILKMLKQAEAGTPVPEPCLEHGMGSPAFYNWRSRLRQGTPQGGGRPGGARKKNPEAVSPARDGRSGRGASQVQPPAGLSGVSH